MKMTSLSPVFTEKLIRQLELIEAFRLAMRKDEKWGKEKFDQFPHISEARYLRACIKKNAAKFTENRGLQEWIYGDYTLREYGNTGGCYIYFKGELDPFWTNFPRYHNRSWMGDKLYTGYLC